MSAAERDDGIERLEAALAAALEERNRLWAELQGQRSHERELVELRARLATVERSRWWRAGKPLRIAQRLAADPLFAFDVLLARARVLRARLGR